MKILIIGFSGSGKSTLARVLGEFYNIPVLHLDSLHFLPNWEIRDRSDFEEKINTFIEQNNNYIIDGNYSKYAIKRFDEADIIIYLKYNRFICLLNAIKRYKKYKNLTRPDMALGCEEKLDFEFVKWILYKGRTKDRRKKLKEIINNCKDGIVFNNRRSLNKYLKRLGVNTNGINC